MTWSREAISYRHVRTDRGRRVDTIEAIRQCIKSNWFRELVAEISKLSIDRTVGRPRRHAHSTVALMYVLSMELDSQAEAESYFHSLNHWEALRRALAVEFPDDPLLARGTPAPTRSVVRHLKKRFSDDFGGRLLEIMEADAIARATFMNLGHNTGTMLEPSRNAILFGDGVVIRPPSDFRPGDRGVDVRTGEMKPRRFDPEATFHSTGTGDRVYGNQFCHLSAFTGVSGEQITFSVRPIRKGAGPTEAQHAIDMAKVVVDELSGFAALAWDKALRSITIDKLWDLRLQPLVGVYDKTGRSTEFVPLDEHEVNGVRVRAFAHRGAVCIKGLGKNPIPLTSVKVTYHPNASGSMRVYGTFSIPHGSNCDTRLWGGTLVQRLNSRNATDVVYGEHVRAINPQSSMWKALYGNRSLAESLNARYKARLLPGQRARSYGQTRQWIDFIVTAMMWNTKATILHSRRTGRSPSALASAA